MLVDRITTLRLLVLLSDKSKTVHKWFLSLAVRGARRRLHAKNGGGSYHTFQSLFSILFMSIRPFERRQEDGMGWTALWDIVHGSEKIWNTSIMLSRKKNTVPFAFPNFSRVDCTKRPSWKQMLKLLDTSLFYLHL